MYKGTMRKGFFLFVLGASFVKAQLFVKTEKLSHIEEIFLSSSASGGYKKLILKDWSEQCLKFQELVNLNVKSILPSDYEELNNVLLSLYAKVHQACIDIEPAMECPAIIGLIKGKQSLILQGNESFEFDFNQNRDHIKSLFTNSSLPLPVLRNVKLKNISSEDSWLRDTAYEIKCNVGPQSPSSLMNLLETLARGRKNFSLDFELSAYHTGNAEGFISTLEDYIKREITERKRQVSLFYLASSNPIGFCSKNNHETKIGLSELLVNMTFNQIRKSIHDIRAPDTGIDRKAETKKYSRLGEKVGNFLLPASLGVFGGAFGILFPSSWAPFLGNMGMIVGGSIGSKLGEFYAGYKIKKLSVEYEKALRSAAKDFRDSSEFLYDLFQRLAHLRKEIPQINHVLGPYQQYLKVSFPPIELLTSEKIAKVKKFKAAFQMANICVEESGDSERN